MGIIPKNAWGPGKALGGTMAVTRRADYAVRMMYELAQLPAGTWLSVRDLCEAAGVPPTFGSPLVEFLIHAGLVHASGSRQHLLALARAAEELTMAEIIRVADPDFSLAPCAVDPESCNRSSHCGVHRMWQDLDGVVWQRLEETTLADVVADGLPQRRLSGSIGASFAASALGVLR